MQIAFTVDDTPLRREEKEGARLPLAITAVGATITVVQASLAYAVGGFSLPVTLVTGFIGPLICLGSLVVSRGRAAAVHEKRVALMDAELDWCLHEIREHFRVEVPRDVVIDLLYRGRERADFEIDADETPMKYAARYDRAQEEFTLFVWSRAVPVPHA